MSLAIQLLALLLAFVAAWGGAYVALTHHRPALIHAFRRREAEVAGVLDTLHLPDRRAAQFVAVRFVAAPVAAVAVFVLTQSWVFGVLVAGVLYVLPEKLLALAVKRRREKLESQVVDLINSLIATAKSGMNLHMSLQDIADRLPPPICEECTWILRRIAAGESVRAALRAADRRLGLVNLNLVIESLVVNEERGGKLPDLLERIGESLREIARVEERVKTETSGIKLSARLMAVMPLVMCALLYFVSPEQVLMLFNTTLGNLMLVTALAFDYIGFTMIRRLSELEV